MGKGGAEGEQRSDILPESTSRFTEVGASGTLSCAEAPAASTLSTTSRPVRPCDDEAHAIMTTAKSCALELQDSSEECVFEGSDEGVVMGIFLDDPIVRLFCKARFSCPLIRCAECRWPPLV